MPTLPAPSFHMLLSQLGISCLLRGSQGGGSSGRQQQVPLTFLGRQAGPQQQAGSRPHPRSLSTQEGAK